MQKEITLSWFYGGGAQKDQLDRDVKYKEIITLEEYTIVESPDYLFYGGIIFNAFNARDILNNNKSELQEFDERFRNNFIDKFKEDYEELSFLVGNYSTFNAIDQFYEVLGYISYSITSRIKSFIDKTYKDINDRRKGDIIRIATTGYKDLFEGCDNCSVSELIIMLQDNCNRFNSLLQLAFQGEHLKSDASCKSFFEKVFGQLSRAKNNTDYAKNLKDNLKDYIKIDKGRCFATFVRDNGEKYVCFSGFLDVTNTQILEALDSSESEFFKIIKSIADSFPANLITTSLNICRYVVTSNGWVDKSRTIEDLIAEGTFKSLKNKYSCCERKFFAHFNDKMPKGHMHIKFEPCGDCYLGIIYQMYWSEWPKWPKWSYGLSGIAY